MNVNSQETKQQIKKPNERKQFLARLNFVLISILRNLCFTIELSRPSKLNQQQYTFFFIHSLTKNEYSCPVIDISLEQLNEISNDSNNFNQNTINVQKKSKETKSMKEKNQLYRQYQQIFKLIEIIEIETSITFVKESIKISTFGSFDNPITIVIENNQYDIEEYVNKHFDNNSYDYIWKQFRNNKVKTILLDITFSNDIQRVLLDFDSLEIKQQKIGFDEQKVIEWNLCLIRMINGLKYSIELINIESSFLFEKKFAFISSIRNEKNICVYDWSILRSSVNLDDEQMELFLMKYFQMSFMKDIIEKQSKLQIELYEEKELKNPSFYTQYNHNKSDENDPFDEKNQRINTNIHQFIEKEWKHLQIPKYVQFGKSEGNENNQFIKNNLKTLMTKFDIQSLRNRHEQMKNEKKMNCIVEGNSILIDMKLSLPNSLENEINCCINNTCNQMNLNNYNNYNNSNEFDDYNNYQNDYQINDFKTSNQFNQMNLMDIYIKSKNINSQFYPKTISQEQHSEFHDSEMDENDYEMEKIEEEIIEELIKYENECEMNEYNYNEEQNEEEYVKNEMNQINQPNQYIQQQLYSNQFQNNYQTNYQYHSQDFNGFYQ